MFAFVLIYPYLDYSSPRASGHSNSTTFTDLCKFELVAEESDVTLVNK